MRLGEGYSLYRRKIPAGGLVKIGFYYQAYAERGEFFSGTELKVCARFNRFINDVSALTKIKVGTLRKYILRKTMPYIKAGASLRFRVSEREQR